MGNLSKAEELAHRLHANQFDKAGEPYVKHLGHVANAVKTDEAKTVAWLHDILEDTACKVEDLQDAGFSNEVIDAVVAITKVDGEPYETYIARVKTNHIAREVKIADMTHNSDLSRLASITEKDVKRVEKYQHYLSAL